MIRTFCKLVIGFTLTGCTVNNFHPDSFSVAYKISHRENTFVELEQKVEPALAPVVPTTTPVIITGNTRIRPECGPYTPLPVPEPVRVDFNKLEAAKTSVEINAVILENVKEMRQQMISYGKQQQKHYAAYVQRCVVK